MDNFRSAAVASSSSNRTRRHHHRSQSHLLSNYGTRFFPNLHGLGHQTVSSSHGSHRRQEPDIGPSSSSITSQMLQSFATTGPLIPRLVESNAISSPMYTVTLQRDTVDIGGNIGMLSLGGLPNGVKNDSLTWVGVRRYTTSEGGMAAPPDSPSEVYPMAWEVYIDAVYFDGQKVPQSSLASSSLRTSALIDTVSLVHHPLHPILTILIGQLSYTRPLRHHLCHPG